MSTRHKFTGKIRKNIVSPEGNFYAVGVHAWRKTQFYVLIFIQKVIQMHRLADYQQGDKSLLYVYTRQVI